MPKKHAEASVTLTTPTGETVSFTIISDGRIADWDGNASIRNIATAETLRDSLVNAYGKRG